MNPYSELIRQLELSTHSQGVYGALFVVLTLKAAAYSSGFTAGGNVYRYVGDQLVAQFGELQPFVRWAVAELHTGART